MLGFILVFIAPNIANSTVMLGFLSVFNVGISISIYYIRYCEFNCNVGIYIIPEFTCNVSVFIIPDIVNSLVMLGFLSVFIISDNVNSLVMLGFLLVFIISDIVNSLVILGFLLTEDNSTQR